MRLRTAKSGSKKDGRKACIDGIGSPRETVMQPGTSNAGSDWLPLASRVGGPSHESTASAGFRALSAAA